MEPEATKLKQIRTFEGDVASAIKNQNESIISIQRAEVNRREANQGESVEVEEHSSRALILALSTLILLGGGGVGAYFAYTTYIEKTALPIIETAVNEILSPTNTVDIDASTLSRQAMLGVFAIERSHERGESAITHIQMTRGADLNKEILSPADLLTRLNSNAPGPLVRAMSPILMAGVLGANPPHTFLIIKLNSFENAFRGMLEWEGRMAEDILPIFADNEVVERVPTDSVWKDRVIQNRDVRILSDVSGNTVLTYGFFENNLLIIADNEETWSTLAQRLEAQKLSR